MHDQPQFAVDDVLDEADEGTLEKVRDLAEELTVLERMIKTVTMELDELKEKHKEIKQKRLPDLMNEVGIDTIGVPSMGVDIKLTPYCRASIPVTWPEDKRKDAFKHLEDIGGGDLIKSEVSVKAGRGDYDDMKRVMNRVTQMLAEYDIAGEVKMTETVQWNTLSSFVKEQMLNGETVDLDCLGAHYGEVADIKSKE